MSELYKYILGVSFLSYIAINYCLTQQNSITKPTDFQYIKFEEKVLVSTHNLKISLIIPDDFNKSNLLNYQPVFHEHPFNVSAAAVYNSERIIMVHAEAVTDSSVFLNYSYLDDTQLNGLAFYTKETCVEITDELMAQAVDIKFFQDEGFDFNPAIYLKQFFQTTPDNIYEYVLNYGERVCDCSDTTINREFKEDYLSRLENTIVFNR